MTTWARARDDLARAPRLWSDGPDNCTGVDQLETVLRAPSVSLECSANASRAWLTAEWFFPEPILRTAPPARSTLAPRAPILNAAVHTP